MKTIIHVWTHNFNIDQNHLDKYNYLKETYFYFGLGDLIRSTIKLYYLSKNMNFRLIVDTQLHPISHFLKKRDHEYSQYVYENKHNIDYVCYGAVEDYIHSHKENDILLFLTNDFYEGEIDLECKNFIKQILTPNEEYQKFIHYKISKIPYPTFNIIHYRVNDNEFLNISQEIVYNNHLHHLEKCKEYNDVLITDTKKLKHYFYLNDPSLFMFDTKICHLGLSNDIDEIRDTLFEFFLLTYASKIKTYCKIHEISGFVSWSSRIYDVPVEKV